MGMVVLSLVLLCAAQAAFPAACFLLACKRLEQLALNLD
jgi:hypothetical protein